MKKFILSLTVLATVCGTPSESFAQYSVESCGGDGYEESMVCPSLTPYIALCVVATAGIVAIAVRHTHGHSHSH